VLRTPWIADLVERVDQCVLVVRRERKVEVDGGASGRVTEGFPVVRDSIPDVLDTYVIPRWCELRIPRISHPILDQPLQK